MFRSPHRSNRNDFARLTCCGLVDMSGEIGGVTFAIELTLVYSK